MKSALLVFISLMATTALGKKITLNDLISKINAIEQDISLTMPKPFIKEISLRLDDDHEFKEGDIEVEARFSLDNYKEYRLKKKLYENQKKRKKIIQKISMGDDLNQVIQLYISLNMYRKKYQLLKKMNTVLKDNVSVNKKLVNKGRADAKDYLDAIEKLETNQQESKNHLIQIKALVTAINHLVGENYTLDQFAENERLVSVNYIKEKLKQTTVSDDALSVKLTKFNLEKMQIERKLEIEEDNKILEFVGIGFDQRQLPGTREFEDASVEDQRLSIKLGFLVPFLDSNMKRAENTIESFIKQRKARVDYSESESNMVLLKGEVDNLADRVEQLENSKALREAKRFLRIYSRRSGISPLKILDINSYLIDAELKLNELRSELYVKFYQYMYEIGKLKFENKRLVISS
ncbi:MAG: hypothetical protein CME62_05435 [Halobacteriovoraceae bacterium]|nr:hypothetical protein [Halobacteriovoraceae bacterium]|tara:strand:+ start:8163 stop:9383 length:1221 start_codon:yes stop_codon:yes gene_type:complete